MLQFFLLMKSRTSPRPSGGNEQLDIELDTVCLINS